MATLHDILWDLNNEDLAFRIRLLGVKLQRPNKANLIDGIKTALAGNGLKAVWDSLEALEQSAVAEACYAPGFLHDETRFKAKYGSLPAFCTPAAKDKRYGSFRDWDPKRATRLNLLLFPLKRSRERVVPSDLAERLGQFVPKPADLTVATLSALPPEENLFVRLTEHEATSEVMALLRLAEQGNLQISAKTGTPSAAGCKRILACQSGGDFFPPEVAHRPDKESYEEDIGPIKPVAWARLLLNGRYLAVSGAGAKSKLTPAGIKALSQAPHEIIRHLWTKWLANTAYDEFNRINNIKGQYSKGHMTAKPPRREAIGEALLDCPANEWIDPEKFAAYMRAEGYEFEVSRNPWKLYLAEQQYGNFGYAGYGGWNIVQFRYLLCLLFEYAATLGLLDIAYVHPYGARDDFAHQWGADDLEWLSRYDGLRAFRITNLGAYCLGITDDFKPTQPASSLELTVLPDLTIRMQSGTIQAAEQMLLETWAEPVDPGIWRLEPTRAREAVERGQSADDFAEFLQRCDSQPLPQTVEGFLKSSVSDGRALRNCGEAVLFECRDAKTAAMIHAQSDLRDLCHPCGESLLAVPEAHVEKFRKVVRSLGLGVV